MAGLQDTASQSGHVIEADGVNIYYESDNFTMTFSTRIERASDGWLLDRPVWLREPPPKGNLEWSDVSRDAGDAADPGVFLAIGFAWWR